MKAPLLGELLVQKKAISKDQLEEGINSQVVFGGRLGTNLVELGYLKEKTLGQFLAEKHKVPYVPPDNLNQIDPKAIKAFPKALAVKYKVVPLKLENKKVHLLMLDPSDFQAIDEIGFSLNCVVRPYAVPEIRLLALLEKFYGLKRDLRYITLSRADTEEFLKGRTVPPQSPAAQKKAAAPVPGRSNEEDLMPEEEFNKITMTAQKPGAAVPSWQEDVVDLTQEAEDIELVPIQPAQPEPPGPSPSQDFMDEAALDASIVKELEKNLISGSLLTGPLKEETPAQEGHPPSPVEYAAPGPMSFQEAAQKIESAASRDDIAKAVLGLALSKFARAILFTVQRGLVMGWDGYGRDMERGTADKLAIPLTLPSAFKLVYDTNCHYLGSFPPTPVNEGFLKAISPGGKPRSSVLLPILFKGKIVNLLYGDNGPDDAATDIGELLILAQKIPLAFEKIIQKRKQMAA